MSADFHLQKIDDLTPKAAKIALRLLDADPRISSELVLALRPALVERSSEAEGFRNTDWMAIASVERPSLHRFMKPFESREQRHARLWLLSLRQTSVRMERSQSQSWSTAPSTLM